MLFPEEYWEFLRGSSGLPKAEAGRYPVGLDQKLAQHHGQSETQGHSRFHVGKGMDTEKHGSLGSVFGG